MSTHAVFQLRLTDTTNPANTDFVNLAWVPDQNGTAVTADAVEHENIQDGLWWSTHTIGVAGKGPSDLIRFPGDSEP